MSTQKPLVLLPAGPFSWGSLWHIRAQVKDVLKDLDADFVRVPVYERPDEDLLKRFRSASCWVLPSGSPEQGVLRYVEKLTKLIARRPIVLMTNGEATKGFLYMTGFSHVLRTDDLILASCAAERNLIRSAFPTAKNVVRMPLPVAPEFFERVSRAAIQGFKLSLGMSASDPFYVYAGRLTFQKNVHALLDAFAVVLANQPRARLYLLGEIDQWGLPHFGKSSEMSYSHFLTWRASRLGISHAVHFMGSVNQESLKMFLASCDAHVTLTLHYGEDFGYSVAQGLACGAPTVVTRWGGGADFSGIGAAIGVKVRVGKSGPEVDRISASRALVSLLDPATRKAWRDRAKELSWRELHPDAHVKAWKRLLREWKPSEESSALKPAREIGRFYVRQARKWEKDPANSCLFKSPRHPLYQRICREYAKSTLSS